MITLAIDASTYVGTVAVWRGDELAAIAEAAMRGAHEERLMPAVADALACAGAPLGPADRVVCGAGPGSFTSLRIAGSIAKGLASGSGARLLAVPSLALIATDPALGAGRYLTVLDALRGECYIALYERRDDGGVDELAPARIVSATALEELARGVEAEIVGPLHGRRVAPHASGAMSVLASLGDAARADLGSWEPAYGRLAEAQVRWEALHGRPLGAG